MPRCGDFDRRDLSNLTAPEDGTARFVRSLSSPTHACRRRREMHERRTVQLKAFQDAQKQGLAQVDAPKPSIMLERVYAKLARVAPLRVLGLASLPVCGLLEPVLVELDRSGHPLAA